MEIVSKNRSIKLNFPHIMGILNVTPDSFSDGKKYQRLGDAIDHTAKMIDAGATLIDVGGESTRPGSKKISDEEEATRVIPVIKAISQRFDIFISVNTSKAMIINESVSAGANLINDIRSLSEPGALSAAIASKLPICIVHMQGEPSTMQNNPLYKNILEEVKCYFNKTINTIVSAGIKKSKIIIDPGFGFGKSLEHNYSILAKLKNFHDFNMPIMVGMSRKSMISQLINLPSHKQVLGSVACAIIAALQGVQIIRVHDVKQTVETMHIVKATLKHRESMFNFK